MITKEQMESIAGEKGEYRFHGETSDGISYTWIYDGSKIKNPIEQKLKVEFSEENLDEIKKAADKVRYTSVEYTRDVCTSGTDIWWIIVVSV